MSRELMRDRKVGVVLAGGGFKGAYQIGAWKAIQEVLGIELPHSISGTSAGALNAVLIANGDMELAADVWRTRSFMALQPRQVAQVATGYVLLFFPVVAAVVCYGVGFSLMAQGQWPHRYVPYVILAFVLIFVLIFVHAREDALGEASDLRVAQWRSHAKTLSVAAILLAPLLFLGNLFARLMGGSGMLAGETRWIAWQLAMVFLTLVSIGAIVQAQKTRHFYLIDPMRLAWTGTALMLSSFVGSLWNSPDAVLAAVGLERLRPGTPPLEDFLTTLAFSGKLLGLIAAFLLIAFPVGFLGMIYGTFVSRMIGRRLGRNQLFSNEAILETAGLEVDKLRGRARRVISIFVTVAKAVVRPNPFRLNVRSLSNTIAGIDRECPPDANYWLADYRDILAISDRDKAIDSLRLTSALPFVFLGGLSQDEDLLVDGGLADNIPLVPLLKTKEIDFLVVILLEPLDAADFAVHMFRTWRIWYTSRITTMEARDLYRKWNAQFPAFAPFNELSPSEYERTCNRVLPERAVLPDNFIVLAPSRHLAAINLPGLRFLTGTLNFLPSWRARWLETGYQETLRLLRTESHKVTSRMSKPA